MAERITTIIVSLIGLVVLAAVAGSVAMVGLAATGDVGMDDIWTGLAAPRALMEQAIRQALERSTNG